MYHLVACAESCFRHEDDKPKLERMHWTFRILHAIDDDQGGIVWFFGFGCSFSTGAFSEAITIYIFCEPRLGHRAKRQDSEPNDLQCSSRFDTVLVFEKYYS